MTYQKDLTDALEHQKALKSEIEFLRCQVKLEQKQETWAGDCDEIKRIKTQYPFVQVTNNPGTTILTLNLSSIDAEPALLGYECFRTTTITACYVPIELKIYRHSSMPITFQTLRSQSRD